MFSPFHILLISIIREFIIFFVFFDTNKLGASIYVCIGIFVSIFLILVFIEIIELNFCGLSKMTKKNIELRARQDSSVDIDVDDNSEGNNINIKGYILDVEEDDNAKETNDSNSIDMSSLKDN